MRIDSYPATYQPDYRPIHEVQVETLNRALTAEVLRHAQTRQQLADLLNYCWAKEHLEPVEIVREIPVIVTRRVLTTAVERRKYSTADAPPSHWEPGHVQAGNHFPLALAERTGLAAFIQRPLTLKSGAILDPEQKAAVKDGYAVPFPDSSWLIVSALARARGGLVTSDELREASMLRYGGVRSAMHRARLTLRAVGAWGDIEISEDRKSGWRMLLEVSS